MERVSLLGGLQAPESRLARFSRHRTGYGVHCRAMCGRYRLTSVERIGERLEAEELEEFLTLNLLLRSEIMNPAIFEVLPHPKHPGDWMLKAGHGVPFDLWYGRKEYAVSYAEWVAREMDRAEIRVLNRDGSLAERLILEKGNRVA
jgi:hypothetical protein